MQTYHCQRPIVSLNRKQKSTTYAFFAFTAFVVDLLYHPAAVLVPLMRAVNILVPWNVLLE